MQTEIIMGNRNNLNNYNRREELKERKSVNQ